MLALPRNVLRSSWNSQVYLLLAPPIKKALNLVDVITVRKPPFVMSEGEILT
jgi:hypothetical protein